MVARYRKRSNALGFGLRWYLDQWFPDGDFRLLAVDGVPPTDATPARRQLSALPAALHDLSPPRSTTRATCFPTARSAPRGRAFRDWLLGPEGRDIIRRRATCRGMTGTTAKTAAEAATKKIFRRSLNKSAGGLIIQRPGAARRTVVFSPRGSFSRMQSRDAIRAIKERLNIVDVVRRYVELKRNGPRWVAPCPFHQETKPSLLRQ